MRNGVIGGRWTVADAGPVNLCIGNTPGAPGFYYLPKNACRGAQEAGSYTLLWTQELWPEIERNPWRFVATLFRKVQLFFNSWDIPDNGNYYFVRRYVAPLRFLTFGPLFLWAAGATGFVLTLRQWRRLIPLYMFGLFFSLSIIIVFISGRFKLPFLGLLAVFAGGGLTVILENVRAGRWRMLVGAVALVGMFTFLFWPRGPVGLNYQGIVPLRPNEFLSNSKSLLEHGRRAEAVRILEDGEMIFPGDASFPLVLSRFDMQEQQPEAATARIETFLTKRPELTQELEVLMELRVAVYWKMGKKSNFIESTLDLHEMFPDNALAQRVISKYGGLSETNLEEANHQGD
jgi:hypothetical protein